MVKCGQISERLSQLTIHSVVFKKELRQVEINIWKENPRGDTIQFQWAWNSFHIIYHCVAVRVSWSNTDLCLCDLLPKCRLACTVRCQRNFKFWAKFTLQVTSLRRRRRRRRKFLMCESIGHQSLWSCCHAPYLNPNHKSLEQGTGTADHLMLLKFCDY